jgi:hypothetical protein
MSNEKARLFLYVYFNYENKEKYVGNAKFGNDAIFYLHCVLRELCVMIFFEKILRIVIVIEIDEILF